jgi:hypothetical protein
MIKTISKFISFISLTLLFTSCNKGYEVRVRNLYIEPMDSVIIGSKKIVFEQVARQVSTDYQKIDKGEYPVVFVSKSKVRIASSITIPKRKHGKRTLQIDGTGRVLVLED